MIVWVSDLAVPPSDAVSAVTFNTGLERDLADTKALDARVAGLRTSLLRQYGVKTVDDLPINFRAVSLQENEAHGHAIFEKHFGRLFDAIERQDAAYEWGGLIAPLLAVRTLSMSLAGTDFAHHRHFTDAAERYRRAMVGAMNGDILTHPTAAGAEYLAGAGLWKTVPPFRYDTPPASWALGHRRTSIMLLAAAAGGSGRRRTRHSPAHRVMSPHRDRSQHMVWHIVRHEWRLLTADKTPWLVLALLGLSVAYAIATGAQWATLQRRTLDDAGREQRAVRGAAEADPRHRRRTTARAVRGPSTAGHGRRPAGMDLRRHAAVGGITALHRPE